MKVLQMGNRIIKNISFRLLSDLIFINLYLSSFNSIQLSQISLIFVISLWNWKFLILQFFPLPMINQNKTEVLFTQQNPTKICFDRTQLEIYQFNELRLVELQNQMHNSKLPINLKQVILKIYNVFDDLRYIYQRLDIQVLYDQFRAILNIISKLILISDTKPATKPSKLPEPEQQSQQDQQREKITTKASQLEKHRQELREKEKKKKINPFGGVFLYNQSYRKYVERDLHKHKISKLKQFKMQEDQSQKKDELERQQMNYFLEKKNELTIIKIKDHSKSYQQIENSFRGVEERLKQMVYNLQNQLESENLKQFQYLSKDQMNNEIVNFNRSMRVQLIVLKDQYNEAAQNLRKQNLVMRNKLNEEIARRNSMVDSSVQTLETVASIKKVKKLVEEYQKKIKKYQSVIQQENRKERESKVKFEQYIKEKEKDMRQLYQIIYNKDETIKGLNRKYENLIQNLNQREEEIQRKQKYLADLELFLRNKFRAREEQGEDRQLEVGRRKSATRDSFLNRIMGKKNILRSISKNSRFSSISDLSKEQNKFYQHKMDDPNRKLANLTSQNQNENGSRKRFKQQVIITRWNKNKPQYPQFSANSGPNKSNHHILHRDLTDNIEASANASHQEENKEKREQEGTNLQKDERKKNKLKEESDLYRSHSKRSRYQDENIQERGRGQDMKEIKGTQWYEKGKTWSIESQKKRVESFIRRKSNIAKNVKESQVIRQGKKSTLNSLQDRQKLHKKLKSDGTFEKKKINDLKKEGYSVLEQQTIERRKGKKQLRNQNEADHNPSQSHKHIPAVLMSEEQIWNAPLNQKEEKLVKELYEMIINKKRGNKSTNSSNFEMEFKQFSRSQMNEMLKYELRRKRIFEEVKMYHNKKCNDKVCTHLKAFFEFCKKFKQLDASLIRNQQYLKLHIQKLQYF